MCLSKGRRGATRNFMPNGCWPLPKHKFFGKRPYKISNLQSKANACALSMNPTSVSRRL